MRKRLWFLLGALVVYRMGTFIPVPGIDAARFAQFFSQRGAQVPHSRPKLDIPVQTGKTGLKSGQRVRHPKYGEGVVFRREGDGDDAKVTVQFSKFGVKKLVERFAQLERL